MLGLLNNNLLMDFDQTIRMGQGQGEDTEQPAEGASKPAVPAYVWPDGGLIQWRDHGTPPPSMVG